MSIITFSEDQKTLVVDLEVFEAVEDNPKDIEVCVRCHFCVESIKDKKCELETVFNTDPRCINCHRTDGKTIHWVKNPTRSLIKRKSKLPEQSQLEIDIINQLL